MSDARFLFKCTESYHCFPPRKSSAERRMRATSPKLRVDEAREGSLNSPEPVGADSAKKVPLLLPLLCFVAKWMLSINGCAIVRSVRPDWCFWTIDRKSL